MLKSTVWFLSWKQAGVMYNNGETKPFVPHQTEIVKSGGGGGGQVNYQLFFSTFYYSTHLCLEKLPPRPSHPSAHISPVAVESR